MDPPGMKFKGNYEFGHDVMKVLPQHGMAA